MTSFFIANAKHHPPPTSQGKTWPWWI